MAAFRTLSVRREESLGPGGYCTRSEEGEAQHWIARVQEIAGVAEKLQLLTHSKVVAVAEQSMTEEVVLHTIWIRSSCRLVPTRRSPCV